MLRIALLISLLVSLVFMIRQFTLGPLPGVQGVQSRTRPGSAPPPGNDVVFGQKPAVRAAPEVNDGYLFVEERQLDETDFGEFGGGGQETSEAAASLEGVFYSGSLIVGEIRQALITYQENIRGGGRPNRLNPNFSRGRAGAGQAQSDLKSKVLTPGDRFMGYLVAAVEPEKIVFEKGGEKVEKFLFDQDKKRPAVTVPIRTAPTPGPGGVSAAVGISPANLPPGLRTAPAGGIPMASSPTRRPVRSERLPRVYVPPGGATRPTAPRRPVPSHN